MIIEKQVRVCCSCRSLITVYDKFGVGRIDLPCKGANLLLVSRILKYANIGCVKRHGSKMRIFIEEILRQENR